MRWLLGVIVALTLGGGAKAQILTQCGASEGMSYFMRGGILPDEEAGWTPDGISNGNIQLVLNEDEADIFFTDAVGTRSARASGAVVEVVAVDLERGRVVVLVHFADSIEHYFFNLAANEVVWGSVKWDSPIPKTALYRAECSAAP